ncbi:MAG TPA: hypothetical protein VGD78_17170 [Chthoniobacterales bacterium]
MKKPGWMAVWLLLATLAQAGGFSAPPSDPDFVRLGRSRGYYRFSSDSGRWWSFGLGRAPVEEPTPFNHGYGEDVIAIAFDQGGKVASPPVYIYTIRPESFEERKLAQLVQGTSSKADVTRVFGSLKMRTNTQGREVWFYSIKVYNPFAEFPDRDSR